MIGRLTPRPAAEFSADKINFVIPEVAVTKIQGRWTVRLISRSGSKIRLNDSYAQAVVQSKDKETMQLWKGRLTEARELLHEALLRNPQDAASMLLLANIYLDGNEDPAVAELLARKSAGLHDRPEAWQTLARALRALDREDEARLAEARAVLG